MLDTFFSHWKKSFCATCERSPSETLLTHLATEIWWLEHGHKLLLKCQEKSFDVCKMQENAWWPGMRCMAVPPQEPYPRSRPFGPRLSPLSNFQTPELKF